MIERCRDAFPVRLMCRCLRVSPSGYYGWRERPASCRKQANRRLLVRIRSLHAESDGVLGSPRMWEELRYLGESCGRHRVARLMRAADLQGVSRRKGPRTTRRQPGAQPAPDLVQRDFTTTGPNELWVA